MVCIGGLTMIGVAFGYAIIPSFVAGTGFVLTSTAIVMQMLQERNSLSTLKGQRIIAILLFEDLAIVPLLVLVTFLGSWRREVNVAERLLLDRYCLAATVALIFAGRYLLNLSSGCWRLPARAR